MTILADCLSLCLLFDRSAHSADPFSNLEFPDWPLAAAACLSEFPHGAFMGIDLGYVLGPFWVHFGAFLGPFGYPWARLVPILAPGGLPGALWQVLGGPGGAPGAPKRPIWGIFLELNFVFFLIRCVL